MASDKKLGFLCGVIKGELPPHPARGFIDCGLIELRQGGSLLVDPDDPGLSYLAPGKRRMIVVRGNTIIAVFGRPRIRLLRMLEQGVDVTQDLIDCYQPMYPKPEKIFRSTRRWKGTSEQRAQKYGFDPYVFP